MQAGSVVPVSWREKLGGWIDRKHKRTDDDKEGGTDTFQSSSSMPFDSIAESGNAENEDHEDLETGENASEKDDDVRESKVPPVCEKVMRH